MNITYCTLVENPVCEEFVLSRAKHNFIMADARVWRDWQSFRTDLEYKERCEAFYPRIRVVKTTPNVSVVDGWYRVTSVLVTMAYEA